MSKNNERILVLNIMFELLKIINTLTRQIEDESAWEAYYIYREYKRRNRNRREKNAIRFYLILSYMFTLNKYDKKSKQNE